MNKVLHFDGVLKNFNQHKVLSFNSKKFGTMFVRMVIVSWQSLPQNYSNKNGNNMLYKRFVFIFVMVGMWRGPNVKSPTT
jgi:hypothetical protein